MPIDREDTLKKAEKLLRQGRLDAAIAEYVRVVEEHPRDWTTANTLGDLFVRAGQLERAAGQYARIAEHFAEDGFYPKAAALFKKILKIRPEDEAIQLQLADVSARQGLYADAKSQLSAVASRRRARGDRRGADEILVRLGSLDPSDFESRAQAARVVADSGDHEGAARRYRALADDLFQKHREIEALAALKEAVRLDPKDLEGRTRLVRSYLALGDLESAREFLDVDTARDDPALLLRLAEDELREDSLDRARVSIARALALDSTLTDALTSLAWGLCQSKPAAAFVCIDVASDTMIARGDFQTAAALLQEYAARAAQQIPALLKLVEVCVDGGLESAMYETQAQLCDAYLLAGHATEARVIAEDLVAREPWERTHIERFRQALVLLKVADPDTVIAERLGGQAPFLATDRFADEGPHSSGDERVEAAEPEPAPAPPAPAEPPPAAARHQEAEVDLDALQRLLREVEDDEQSEAEPIEVDLTSALRSLGAPESEGPPDSPPESLEEVFGRAREEAGRVRGEQDAAAHLREGRALVEAGSLDAAVSALQHAARSPRERFEAAALLARIYEQRQEPALAVEWLERAVESPTGSMEERHRLLYELGTNLEGLGEPARALAVFMELLAECGGSYRDAGDRVTRLSRVETGR